MNPGGRSQPRTPYSTEYRNRKGLAQTIRDTGQRLRRIELKDVPEGLADLLLVSVQKNGALIGSEPILNFIEGSNVTLTMDDDGQVINIEIAANVSGTVGGGGYDTIQDEGTPVAQETVMDFQGAGVTATAGAGKTIITIPGGSATEGGLIHYDYIVDAAYAGSDGDIIALASGQSAIMYKTIQGAVTAADAANAAKTIFINGGTYSEDIVCAGTFDHNLTVIGEDREKVLIGRTAVSSVAWTISSGATGEFYFHNLSFVGDSTSFRAAATNTDAFFENCHFFAGVSGNFTGSRFLDCTFWKGLNSIAGDTFQSTMFTHCEFLGTASNWAGTMANISFVNCIWGGSTDTITINTTGSASAKFTGCLLGITGNKTFMDVVNGAATIEFSGCKFTGPGTNGCIYVESTADSFITVIVSGCYFPVSTTNPYIKFARAGRLIATGNWFEDNGSIDITGIFTDSTFGPNTPPDTNVQLDAGSSACMYIGTGTVSGTDALDALEPLPQRGAGVPTHTAPEGTRYWDTTNNNLYVNNDSATGWTLVGGASGGGTSVILDSTVHTDTLTGTVVLGDLIHGNATPKWARLAGHTAAVRKFLAQTGTGAASAAPAWTVLGRQMVIAVEVATAHPTNTLGFVVWEGDACTMKFNLEFESPPTNLVAQVFELRRAASGSPTSYSTIVTFSFTGNGSTVSYADSTSISVATGDRFVVRHTTGADTSGTRIRVIGLDQ